MVRGTHVVPFAFLLVVLLGLPAATLAGEEETSRRPAPTDVARWILGADEADAARAAQALRDAPQAYLTEVIRHVRGLHTGVPQPTLAIAPAEPTTVLLEARVYSGRRGLAKRLLGESRMHGSHLLDGSETAAVQTELETTEQAQVLSAPSLLIADGQWATVEITKPISYVKSVRVDRSGADTVRNPVIDIVEEGLVLKIRPLISADRKSITLAGALTQTAVERPIPTRTVQVEGGSAEIQAPTVKESRLDLHFTVPDGATVAGAGLQRPTDTEGELLVLLHVRRVGATRKPQTLTPTAALEAPEATRVITMEVRLLRLAPGLLERVLGSAIPSADSPICDLQADDVVRLLGPGRKGTEEVEILGAPRLTTFDGQSANVSVLHQTAYVKDFEVERAEGQVVLDPIIETIQDGLVFDVTPRITDDRTRISFETVTTWAVLTRPIADFTTTIEGQEVTVQLPELRVNRVGKTFDLRAGGYALIGGFDEDPDGRSTCVLLHAFVTDLEAEELELLGEEIESTPR